MASSSRNTPLPETSSPSPPTSPVSSMSDSSATMPPRNPQRNANRPATPKREADLSSLLTVPQKADLVVLVSNITDAMLQQAASAFELPGRNLPDPTPTGTENATRKAWNLPGTLQAPAANTKMDSRLEWKSSMPKSFPTPPRNDPVRAEADLDAKQGRDSSQGELKREALAFFKKWQAVVLKRVGDISTAKEQTAQQGRLPPVKPFSKTNFGSRFGKSSPGQPGAIAGPSRPPQEDIKTSVVEADAALEQLYPPVPTSLCSLSAENRALLLHCMLLLILSLEHYTAYSRVLLLRMASSLRVPLHILAEDEGRLAKALSQVAKDLCGEEAGPKRSDETKARRWKFASPLVGTSGGLAPALAAAGVGAVRGGISVGSMAAAGLLGPMTDGSSVVGALFGLCGARGAGKMMDSYVRDITDLALLPLHGTLATEFREAKNVPVEDRRLRLTVVVSGWLTEEDEVLSPWNSLGHQSEVYALRWDTDNLLKMGCALETAVKSAAWSMAKKEILSGYGELGTASPPGISSGLRSDGPGTSPLRITWPVSLLKISKIVDTPWSVGMVRGDKAGIVLADAIINRVQGERCVTLIGYSLGARVIYTCLMSLAERRVFGLVENAVLMGTPAPSDRRVWSALRSVVSGRLVNVFSGNDYLMGFMYRTSSFQFGVAGLHCIEGAPGVENIDATDSITGHLHYRYAASSILRKIGWEDILLGQVARDEEAIVLAEERLAQDERKRQQVETEHGKSQRDEERSEKKRQQILK